MNRAQVLDTSEHGYTLLFRDAVKATERALRRKWGKGTEIPLMSHALSHIDDNGRWFVRSISGHDVAVVGSDGRATLIDELIDIEKPVINQ